MHIILDDGKKHKAIACVERDAGHASVIKGCCPAHMQQLEAALKGLGIPAITMSVTGQPAVKWLEEQGWKVIPDSFVMVKEL